MSVIVRGDVVTIDALRDRSVLGKRNTFVVQRIEDGMAGLWHTDPGIYQDHLHWVMVESLSLSESCPDHCPVCAADLKVEGFPKTHKVDDDGQDCEWAWTGEPS